MLFPCSAGRTQITSPRWRSTLIIGYSTKALRKLAGSKTLPTRTYGAEVGEAFHARLADILAARSVSELPLWEMVPETANKFLVPLEGGWALVFESNHALDRGVSSGTEIDWRRVTRVKLLEVSFNG